MVLARNGQVRLNLNCFAENAAEQYTTGFEATVRDSPITFVYKVIDVLEHRHCVPDFVTGIRHLPNGYIGRADFLGRQVFVVGMAKYRDDIGALSDSSLSPLSS